MATKSKSASKLLERLVAWNQMTQVLEATLVDNLAATTPWLAPLAPAFMTFDSMRQHLGFPFLVALAIAATVEFLGLATVSTTFLFRNYNRHYRKSIGKTRVAAPTWLAVATMAAYLVIIILLIVLLELFPEETFIKIIAKGLLSLLGLIGALVVAMRGDHRQKTGKWDLTFDMSPEGGRKGGEKTGKLPGDGKDAGGSSGKMPVRTENSEPLFRTFRDVPEEMYLWISEAETKDIVERFQLGGKDPERTARGWRARAGEKLGPPSQHSPVFAEQREENSPFDDHTDMEKIWKLERDRNGKS